MKQQLKIRMSQHMASTYSLKTKFSRTTTIITRMQAHQRNRKTHSDRPFSSLPGINLKANSHLSNCSKRWMNSPKKMKACS